MKAYTPSELRALAGSQRTNPFFVTQVAAALNYSADALEAADKALQAELARAIAQSEQQTVPNDAPEVHYTRGYGVALSDAEEAIDDECRERVVTASDCIELIRNLGAAPHPEQTALAAQAGQSEPVAIPENVRVTAKSMQSNSYRGPIAWAATVIDFVADYAHPTPVRQPLSVVEIMQEWASAKDSVVDFARAIEAKINEKGGV